MAERADVFRARANRAEATIATLTKELEEAKVALGVACGLDHPDALRTQLKEVVEGLKKYGKHKYDCEWVIYSDPTHQWSCTCGFDALLKRLEE